MNADTRTNATLTSPPEQPRTGLSLSGRRIGFATLVLSSSAALLVLMTVTLFTAAPEQAEAVQHAANEADVSVTCIGRITTGSGLQVLDLQGVPMSRRFASFDHFAN